jgi:hypothetical protein
VCNSFISKSCDHLERQYSFHFISNESFDILTFGAKMFFRKEEFFISDSTISLLSFIQIPMGAANPILSFLHVIGRWKQI